MKLPKPYLLLTLVAVAHVILRLAIPHPGFMRDELLYLVQGHHPAFGYASVPPLTAWISAVSSFFFGNSIWAAKVYPALLSGVMVFLVAGVAKEMSAGPNGILLSVAAYSAGPLYLRSFYMLQPVCTDVFLWTVIWYLILRVINGNSRSWYALGIAIGLGLLNKYLIGLQVVALLILMPFTPYRNWFYRREFWMATGLAAVIFLPNVVWQMVHHWPLLNHLRALHDNQLVHVDYAGFLTDQMLMPFAGALLTIPGFVVLLVAPDMRPYRVVGWAVALIFLFLLLVSGKSYYTGGLFVPLIGAGAWWWSTLLRRTWSVWAMVALLALLTIPVIPISLPVYPVERLAAYYDRLERKYGLDIGRRFEDGTIHALPQDFADMLGWDELARVTHQAYVLAGGPEKTMIYAENYGEAGAVAIIGHELGLPEPVSFHESYLYWAPREIPENVHSLIYINDELGEDVEAFFGQVDSIGQITNPLAREFGTTVYLCREPSAPLQKLWQSALDRVAGNPF
ncbi:MAG: glycosyltransferase family 39 protein [Saprospiraceae bacterium]